MICLEYAFICEADVPVVVKAEEGAPIKLKADKASKDRSQSSASLGQRLAVYAIRKLQEQIAAAFRLRTGEPIADYNN